MLFSNTTNKRNKNTPSSLQPFCLGNALTSSFIIFPIISTNTYHKNMFTNIYIVYYSYVGGVIKYQARNIHNHH